jgi:hypothetical protein
LRNIELQPNRKIGVRRGGVLVAEQRGQGIIWARWGSGMECDGPHLRTAEKRNSCSLMDGGGPYLYCPGISLIKERGGWGESYPSPTSYAATKTPVANNESTSRIYASSDTPRPNCPYRNCRVSRRGAVYDVNAGGFGGRGIQGDPLTKTFGL